MENTDVSWSGELYHKTKLTSPLVWGMLLRESATGYNRLELHSQPMSCRSVVGNPLYTIQLSNALNVVVETNSKLKCFDFTIICVNGREQFSLKREEERTCLVHKLKCLIRSISEPCIIYNFQVQVLPSSTAEKMNLAGSYLLKIFESGVALYSASGNLPTLFNCPFSDLKDVKYTRIADKDNVSLGHVWLLCSGVQFNKEGSMLFCSKSAISIVRIIETRKGQDKGDRKISKSLSTPPGAVTVDLALSQSYLESITSWLGKRSPLNPKQDIKGEEFRSKSEVVRKSPFQRKKLIRRRSSEHYVQVDEPHNISPQNSTGLTHYICQGDTPINFHQPIAHQSDTLTRASDHVTC